MWKAKGKRDEDEKGKCAAAAFAVSQDPKITKIRDV